MAEKFEIGATGTGGDEYTNEEIDLAAYDDEDFEPEIITLDDEPFEVIGDIPYEGEKYVALTPYDEDEELDDDEEVEFIIMRETQEGDEYFLVTIDDDELYTTVGNLFIERFNELMDGLPE